MAKGEAEKTGEPSGQSETDKLLQRCRSDAAAFSLLYDIYYERIFKFAVDRVQIKQVAQDLTSTAFLAASQNASKFSGSNRTDFVNWLYQIATEKINDYLKRIQTFEKPTVQEQDLKPQTSTRPALHNAIVKLSVDEQAVIVLRFFENLSIERVADITDLKPENVREKIAAAIGKLKFCETENQLAEIVKNLNIDYTPDSNHKEKLRAKIIPSFNLPVEKEFQVILCSIILVILIIAGLGLWFFRLGIKKPLLKIIAPAAPAAKEVNIAPKPIEKTRLEKIRLLVAKKDIEGLKETIKNGDLPSRLLATKFLAELTETNAADLLKQANPAQGNAEPNKSALQKILIQVIDKRTKQPITDVQLQVQFNNEQNKFSTDSNGQYVLELADINQLRIKAEAKGYAPMKIHSGETAAQNISFEMSHAETIGGMVFDEKLNGIENAQVNIRIEQDTNSGRPVFDTDQSFRTDVNGIWQCRDFPQDVCQVFITVTHPDYIREDTYEPAVLEQLKNLSHLTILEKGIAVSGTVFDWNKKPLEAIVSRGANFDSRNSIICDANGQFKFVNLNPGKEILTVQCKGAAPEIKEINVEPNMQLIVFELQSPKTIRARIVDSKGMPVKDAEVKISDWRGYETLNFETKTDENGYFQWADAPADEVLFNINKAGFKPITNFAMTSENDYVITLEPQ